MGETNEIPESTATRQRKPREKKAAAPAEKSQRKPREKKESQRSVTPFELEARKSLEDYADEDMAYRVETALSDALSVVNGCRKAVIDSRRDLVTSQRAFVSGEGGFTAMCEAMDKTERAERALEIAVRLRTSYFKD